MSSWHFPFYPTFIFYKSTLNFGWSTFVSVNPLCIIKFWIVALISLLNKASVRNYLSDQLLPYFGYSKTDTGSSFPCSSFVPTFHLLSPLYVKIMLTSPPTFHLRTCWIRMLGNQLSFLLLLSLAILGTSFLVKLSIHNVWLLFSNGSTSNNTTANFCLCPLKSTEMAWI